MIHMSNCDDCTVNLPFDLALELTKVYYSCAKNNGCDYYKDDILKIYKYFKEELSKGENRNEYESKNENGIENSNNADWDNY